MQTSAYKPKIAERLNPDLPINPPLSTFGSCNAVLTGTSRQYFVPDFRGPCSLKATLRGTSTWKVDGRHLRVSESTFLLVNAKQPYTITYDEPEEVTTFCLLFRDGYLEEFASAMYSSSERMLENPFRASRIELPNHLQVGPSEFLNRLRRFAHELGDRQVHTEIWELRFQQLAEKLLYEAISEAPRETALSAVKGSTRHELLRRVSVGRDFLISMSDYPTKVEDAARAACLSTFHFHRVFSEAFGSSPHVLLRSFRMHRAQQLLISTRLPISEIAVRVGFLSVGSFGNTFLKTVGVSPRLYRENNTHSYSRPMKSLAAFDE